MISPDSVSAWKATIVCTVILYKRVGGDRSTGRFKDMLTPASQKYLTYISSKDISRKNASRIFQLRVGHAPLNQYLHRFKKVDSPRCPACGHPEETAEHVLLHCPSYDHERWTIKNATGGYLPKMSRLLADKKLLKPLASFIEATGRWDLEANAVINR